MTKHQRGIHRLGNATQIAKLPDGRHHDGGGLYVQVRGASRSWLFRTKDNWMGLGSFDTVNPDEAREAAREHRKQVLNGIDPLEHKKVNLLDAKLAKAKDKTFREVAEEWRAHKIKSHAWASKMLKQSHAIFENHICEFIGHLPVQKFDMRREGNSAVALVKSVLEPIWYTKTATANRAQIYLEEILNWAIAKNYIGGPNAASMKNGAPLAILLPKICEFYAPVPHPALPWREVGRFMETLRAYTWTSDNFSSSAAGSSKNPKRYCRICYHPERAAIEEAILAGADCRKSRYAYGGYKAITARFGVTQPSIKTHRRHMPGVIKVKCAVEGCSRPGDVALGYCGTHYARFKRTGDVQAAKQIPEGRIHPISAYALEFIILTAVRKGQAVKAKWEEIDWDNKIWKCEEHKTRKWKMTKSGETVLTGVAHVVPLSDAAMAVLGKMKELQEANGIDSEFVFHAEQGSKHGHLSISAVYVFLRQYFLKRMQAFDFGNPTDWATVHGFRTCFASWAEDHNYDEKDSEMALAHTIGSSTRNIYKRNAVRIENRRPMMQAWATQCAGPLPAGVLPFKQAKSK